MRLRTLIGFSLFAITVQAQTKESEFQKVQELVKKSNGLASKNFSIISQSFNEKTIRMEISESGTTSTLVCSGLNWDKFTYNVEELEEDKNIAKVSISFDKEVSIASYEGQKKLETVKHDEMLLYINASDAKAMKQQLRQLQLYTWKALIEVRTADKAGLVSFITKHLNKALKEDDGRVKSISECSLTIAYDDEEITMPVKILKIHEKNFLESWLFCYGKAGAPVQKKTSSGTETSNLEHPDIELDFSYDFDAMLPVELALKKLATYCSH